MSLSISKLDREEPLLGKVEHFIQKHNLTAEQETLLVGVSGGPDSVCLLHLLVQLKDRLGIELHVAHLNHMLRGAESEADAEYVSELAHRLGVAATIEQREVESYRAEHALSLEEAAREIRYQFFAEVAQALGTSKVVVGHTADDQVETILLHLVRGAGTKGLSGMQPIAFWESLQDGGHLEVIRPLLGVGREETEIYCQKLNLASRRDSSNLSSAYLRNRIRSQLIPLLRSYNPNINEVLLHTAPLLADDVAFLEEQVSQIWDDIVTEQGRVLILNTERASSLHPALQRHLLREVLRRLLGNLRDIEWKHIESMRATLLQPAGKRLSLPRGLVLSTEYGKGIIGTETTLSYPPPLLQGERRLKVPGETVSPNWQVITNIMPAQVVRAKNFEKGELGEESFKAYLDYEVAGSKLIVRKRKPGDRFQPLGMKQTKKLQDFMVDAKIPVAWRDEVPLVCSPQHILWVVGWRIDERAKVTNSTEQALYLEFLPQCTPTCCCL
jgi:tRNA(Ile)-lysidine synthase